MKKLIRAEETFFKDMSSLALISSLDRGSTALFLTACFKRLKWGRGKYGVFNPENDNRRLAEELREECLDIPNYISFIRQKYHKKLSHDMDERLIRCVLMAEAIYQDALDIEKEINNKKEGG